MTEGVLFTEQQRFNQWWLWLLLACISGVFLFGLYWQVVLGKHYGNHPMSNTGLYLTNALVLLLLLFFRILKLETQITKEGLDVRFYPLHFNTRHYSWADIKDVTVRAYSPIGEYGGWGLRTGSGGGAFNVSGDQGIQLVFKNGRRLLIGTNKPEEVARVLAVFREEKISYPGI